MPEKTTQRTIVDVKNNEIAHLCREIEALSMTRATLNQKINTLTEKLNTAEKKSSQLARVEKKLAVATVEASLKDELSNEVTKNKKQISSLQDQLYTAREAAQTFQQENLRLQQLNDMHDTVTKMDDHRASMAERAAQDEMKALQAQLNHYEKSPFRAALKALVLNILRFLRILLPVPTKTKLALSHKMTGVATALLPPANMSVAAQIDMPADQTIDFAFMETDTPVISIIVPVYNEISQTIACLRSIYQQKVSVPYEVILADDKSPDPFHEILKTIKGLRYYRNPENLHFLRNCNRNAAHARGDYLIFLNNDTLVKPGWMQRLYDTFYEHGNIGIAGSKLVFPTGELQEAGGIVWEDGTGWNWGRAQNADHSLYNFVRDVDYISGASLMIPTALWKQVGGFSEDYEKAYYEDTDLCFQIRELGYRVVYQPASELVHIEGLSSGTDLGSGVKKYQIINQEIFIKKWAKALSTHLPNATTPFLASDRSVKGHVLYIDATTPEPDKDSGSLDAVYSMKILNELGYRVHFIPCSNFAYFGQSTKDLQNAGIEAVYHPFYSNLEQFLSERGDMFDYVILSRPESAERCLKDVKKHCPSAKLIYNTVDLHFMRLGRRANRTNDNDVARQAQEMKNKEIGFIENTDSTIVLSTVEHSVLTKQGIPNQKLWTIPLIRAEAERLVDFETTQDIAFIGGYRHPPNVDAVDWLVKEIWPEVRKSTPGVKLHICGSAMPEHFYDYAAEDIIIRGFIPDLDELLSSLRMTIAPLRYGAGLKGKVASSIGAGVPCIGTSVAFEGMAEAGLGTVKLEVETPEAFASVISEVYNDEEKWTQTSLAGVEYHNQNYAYKMVMKTYEAMLSHLN